MRRKGRALTVCIAAISENTYIVGAADRLITYGDTEYEQPNPKILQLASNTVALYSGSPEAHTSIFLRTLASIAGVTSPTVEQIAEAYANQFATLRRQQAERKYLTPIGLTSWNFMNNQTNLTPSVVKDLTEKMEREDLDCSAIIAGVDQTGPHIYVVDDPGNAECYDLDGWAAIGIGNRHADQEFIRDKYERSRPFDESFLLTFLAKKKADITPGVGPTTDMFWIGSGPANTYTLLDQGDDIVRLVHQLHADIEAKEKEMANDAKNKIKGWFAKLRKQQAPAKQEQVSPASTSEARAYLAASGSVGPDHQEDIREGTETGQPPDQPKR